MNAQKSQIARQRFLPLTTIRCTFPVSGLAKGLHLRQMSEISMAIVMRYVLSPYNFRIPLSQNPPGD